MCFPSTPPDWDIKNSNQGINTVTLTKWQEFFDFIRDFYSDIDDFVWRGQRSSSWKLQSTFDRELERTKRVWPTEGIDSYYDHLLKDFKKNSLGKRGLNPEKLDNLEWSALGQHNGLYTPFLDWTGSPFVALFFAFEKDKNMNDNYRSVFALNPSSLRPINDRLGKKGMSTYIFSHQEIVTHENARIINQRGSFTYGPIGYPLDKWVEVFFEDGDIDVLLKINILDSDRKGVLRYLNRMNINHLTLFPDLYGASKYANMKFEISHY